MVKGQMFWISPRGEILDFGTTHIQAIIDHPEKLGTNTKSIEDTYKKFNEPMSVEGDAREEIIVSTTKKGYIRIRFQRNYVSVTVGQWASAAKKLLGQWAKVMSAKNKNVDKYQPVKIYQTSNDKMKNYELADLISGTHMFEMVEDDTPDLKFVNSPEEFMADSRIPTFKEWYDTEM